MTSMKSELTYAREPVVVIWNEMFSIVWKPNAVADIVWVDMRLVILKTRDSILQSIETKQKRYDFRK